ncbi:MAG: hypothetical protein AB8B79_04190 [Granulosicoccus sp.]
MKPINTNIVLLLRLLRLRDAPTYLGMDRNRFNVEVRPNLMEIPIGEQGIAFDRFELDAWIDDYIAQHGRQARSTGAEQWQERKHHGLSNGQASGISTSTSTEGAFAQALEQISSKKLRDL